MSAVSEIFKFLNGRIFYLATVEGDKPKVRPLGFVMEYEDKLYFGTNDTKPTFKQLTDNPNIEISAVSGDGNLWVRISGKAVFDGRPEARAQALDTAPYLKELYDLPESPALRLFYLSNGKAVFQSLDSSVFRTIEL